MLIKYINDQVGPTYSFRIVITDQREAEYLFQHGAGTVHVTVHPVDEFMNNNSSSRMNFEINHSETIPFANISPDPNSGSDNSELACTCWIVHFSTGDPYSTPIPTIASVEPKWWTATILRGRLLPHETLEKVVCFDFCIGNKEESTAFRLISEDDVIVSIQEEVFVSIQVDIPSINFVSNQTSSQVDSLVILPKRQKRKCRVSTSNYTAPLLNEPDLNQHMFDESLVILPTKR